uniref:Uncharacterized protein n=1 Tax=Romanomermis culicivorax TaxID=13658 RepID=A0A915IFA8_ROMCU
MEIGYRPSRADRKVEVTGWSELRDSCHFLDTLFRTPTANRATTGLLISDWKLALASSSDESSMNFIRAFDKLPPGDGVNFGVKEDLAGDLLPAELCIDSPDFLRLFSKSKGNMDGTASDEVFTLSTLLASSTALGAAVDDGDASECLWIEIWIEVPCCDCWCSTAGGTKMLRPTRAADRATGIWNAYYGKSKICAE